jgi:hypothetical protein
MSAAHKASDAGQREHDRVVTGIGSARASGGSVQCNNDISNTRGAQHSLVPQAGHGIGAVDLLTVEGRR